MPSSSLRWYATGSMTGGTLAGSLPQPTIGAISARRQYVLRILMCVCAAQRPAQTQPPEPDMTCNDDVRVSIIGQLPAAAAVAYSGWLCLRRECHSNQRSEPSRKIAAA